MVNKKKSNYKNKIFVGIIVVLLIIIFLLLTNCDIIADSETNVTLPPSSTDSDIIKYSCDSEWTGTEWICDGTCKSTGDRCQLIPTSEVPEDGYVDFSVKPDCGCLTLVPGSCNFYDADGGGSSMDLTCDGSCDDGSECNQWLDAEAGIEHCECEVVPDSACGWKESQLPIIGRFTNDVCVGDCPEGQECVVIDNSQVNQSDTCECMMQIM